MRNRLLALAAIVAALFAGYLAGQSGSTTVQAQPRLIRQFQVPRAWGAFRGVYYDQLLFEDEHGTIRSVYPNGGALIFTVVRR